MALDSIDDKEMFCKTKKRCTFHSFRFFVSDKQFQCLFYLIINIDSKSVLPIH